MYTHISIVILKMVKVKHTYYILLYFSLNSSNVNNILIKTSRYLVKEMSKEYILLTHF